MLLASLLAGSAAAQVSFDWTPVGEPGNPVHPVILHGSVPYAYDIAELEVTNQQYSDFLNAVATDDANFLYATRMGTEIAGGISRMGSEGSYTYDPKPGYADRPVNFVSFWMAARFTNWLQNGMPVGSQDDTTTEDGAYTLTPAGIAANTVVRNASARFAIPTRDEWWKAGYYETGTQVWYLSPAQSQVAMSCVVPSADDGNSASCGAFASTAQAVGAYSLSVSPNGSFDQGGNVREWVDRPTGVNREGHGGDFLNGPNETSISEVNRLVNAAGKFSGLGFRLVRLEVTPVPTLGLPGRVLTIGLLGAMGTGVLIGRHFRVRTL